MEKVKYGLIGFGGIAENRIAKEGFACDKARLPRWTTQYSSAQPTLTPPVRLLPKHWVSSGTSPAKK